jgi:threonine/homoserine efflux transporter RhtA
MTSNLLFAKKPAPLIDRAPPHLFFLVSAIFHYLGPSFAVLLFAQIAPLGVAWLRIASAALIFAVWRRPWRVFLVLSARDRAIILALGLVLAAMNSIFYEAIARLPLGTVGAIEFLGPIAIAAYGLRTRRNIFALALAALGVYALTDVRIVGEPLGFARCSRSISYSAIASPLRRAPYQASTDWARPWASPPSRRCRSASPTPSRLSHIRRCFSPR